MPQMNIQYQHRELINPTVHDLTDLGGLGFSIVGVASYMGSTSVFFSRPRPCTTCRGKRQIKGSDGLTSCRHCYHTDGFEPVSLVAEIYDQERDNDSKS